MFSESSGATGGGLSGGEMNFEKVQNRDGMGENEGQRLEKCLLSWEMIPGLVGKAALESLLPTPSPVLSGKSSAFGHCLGHLL